MRRWKRVLANTTALSATILTVAGTVMAAQAKNFHIKRLPLAEALSKFAQQAGVSIGRPPLSFRDGKSRGVFGPHTTEAALSQLLKGTGYSFKLGAPNVVTIFKTPTKKPAIHKAVASPVFEPVIEEIIVSSIRRLENIQKLPYGISSIGGTSSEQLRVFSTNDAAHHIASMHATNRGAGENKIIMRGLSDGAFSGRAQSLVSTYFDNTRLTYNAPDPALKLIDIERIEAMRGPHGTLYGSGSLTGLFRVVTNKPNLSEMEAEVTGGLASTDGGSSSNEATAVLNIPLWQDKLALRTALYTEKEGGYIDDIRLGLENVNKAETYGGRVALTAKPSENWQFRLGATKQLHNRDDSNYYDNGREFGERANYLQEPRNDDFLQLHATIEGDFGWGQLVSSTSWAERKIDATHDGSLAIPKLIRIDATPSPFTVDRDIETISNETHLSSPTGKRLEWTLGSFWSDRQELVSSSLSVPGISNLYDLGGLDTIYEEILESDLRETALFGEVTYYLSEKLSVTGGLRWFDFHEDALSDIMDVGIALDAKAIGEQKKSGVTPKIVLAYHPTKNLMIYAQRAEGYRLGGINLAGITPTSQSFLSEFSSIQETTIPDAKAQKDPRGYRIDDRRNGGVNRPIEQPTALIQLNNFQSDTLTNYEVGFKFQSRDKALSVNGAAYTTLWHRIQSQQYSFEGLPDIDNVGNARVIGAELEITFQPNHQFELKGYISASNSELTDTSSRFGAQVGSPLPAAPNISLGASVYREFSLTNEITTAFSIDYAYVGGTDLLFEQAFSPEMDGYHLGNARVAFQRSNWRLTFYAENLLNDRSNLFAFGNPLSLEVIESQDPNDPNFVFVSTGLHSTSLRPRTFGVELSWHY